MNRNDLIDTPYGKKRWSLILGAFRAAEVLNTADHLTRCGDKIIVSLDAAEWDTYWNTDFIEEN